MRSLQLIKTLCFGEIMGRFSPIGYKKIIQSNSFELSFAGSEANVAVSLANYGVDSGFVTKIPDNDLGLMIKRSLRSYNVNIEHIVTGGSRLGMYYVEKGVSQRPSKVIYDRGDSAISLANTSDFNWEKILDNINLFHTTGITLALSDNCAEIVESAFRVCKNKGIRISCDLNYRYKLWTPEKAYKIMSKLMKYVDICICNEEDAEKVLDIKAESSEISKGKINRDDYIQVAKTIQQKYGCETVAITLRESFSASINGWSALLYKDGKSFFSKEYRIHIVDRVGGGDSFVGGLLYALEMIPDSQQQIEFATAASCLKQTIEGDFNQVNIVDVQHLMNGDGSGRVNR